MIEGKVNSPSLTSERSDRQRQYLSHTTPADRKWPFSLQHLSFVCSMVGGTFMNIYVTLKLNSVHEIKYGGSFARKHRSNIYTGIFARGYKCYWLRGFKLRSVGGHLVLLHRNWCHVALIFWSDPAACFD